MMRKLVLMVAAVLGLAAAGAHACGDNGAKSGKPDMSKPAAPKPMA